MGPLGILGGGQLARMTLQAASRLGIDVVIGERAPDSPAARMTARSVVFDGPHGWDDTEALARLASLAPIVTLESEFVDWRVLADLEARGARVLPSPESVGVVQDKLLQKQTLARAELAVPFFREISEPHDLPAAAAELGWPLMLKARRDGYDGRGNLVVERTDDAHAACIRLGWPDKSLFAESMVNFERELACLIVRGRAGNVAQYPVVETHQDPQLHICREVLAPANLSDGVRARAAGVARAAVEAVDGVGAFGVELFLLPDGEVCINELAPRPHNTAHYSIEGCWSSQFDNHVRAVLGLPLGDPSLVLPAAAMVNLLGSRTTPIIDADVRAGLANPRTAIHLYGKAENRPGRKMGHVTALAETVEEALASALDAARLVNP